MTRIRFFGKSRQVAAKAALAALLIVVAGLFMHCASAGESRSRAVRIMPLGDFLTLGEENISTYRRYLYKKLVENGYSVDFVGTQKMTSGHVDAAMSGSLVGDKAKDYDGDSEGYCLGS